MNTYAIAVDRESYNGKQWTEFVESEDAYTKDFNQAMEFYILEYASLQCEEGEYVVELKEDEAGNFTGFEKIIVDANA